MVTSAICTSSGSKCHDQGALCLAAPGPGLRIPLGMLAVDSPRWRRKRSSIAVELVTKARKVDPRTSNVATTPPASSAWGSGVGEDVGVAEPVQAASRSTTAANAGKSGHRLEASFALLLNAFSSYAPLRGTWPRFCYLLRISW